MTLTAAEISQYLLDNPAFFTDQPELLLSLKLPHPEAGNLVSLPERQLTLQREKNLVLEQRLREWVEFANENEKLEQKIHQFILALFNPKSTEEYLQLIPNLIRTIFNVPYVAIRIWQHTSPSIEIRCFCDSQLLPSCVHKAIHDSLSWFGDITPLIHSFAYLPLHHNEQSIGLLILGSEDKNRYYPDMDKHVLHRMSQILSAAVSQYLKHEYANSAE